MTSPRKYTIIDTVGGLSTIVTVLEAIKALHLETFDKQYENRNATKIDKKVAFADLQDLPVLGVECNFNKGIVKITVDTNL